MRSFLLPLVLLLFTIVAGAQSINEIISTTRSDSIERLRFAILDKFRQNDRNAVRILKNALLQKNTQEYNALRFAERLAIDYWIKDYEDLLAAAVEPANGTLQYINRAQYYGRPSFEDIAAAVKNDSASVIKALEEADLGAEKKAFLLLLFQYHFLFDDGTRTNDDQANRQADAFIARYPDGEYVHYVLQRIRYKETETGFSIGGEFYAGTSVYTGRLSNYFSNPYSIGIGLHTYWKNMLLNFRAAASISGKTRQDIPVQDTFWNKGAFASNVLLEIAGGYNVINGSRIRITPFIGLTGVSVSAGADDEKEQPELKDAALKVKGGFSFGAITDIRFKRKPPLPQYGPVSEETILRLRYAYAGGIFKNSYLTFAGNVHTITVGIGNLLVSKRRVR